MATPYLRSINKKNSLKEGSSLILNRSIPVMDQDATPPKNQIIAPLIQAISPMHSRLQSASSTSTKKQKQTSKFIVV